MKLIFFNTAKSDDFIHCTPHSKLHGVKKKMETFILFYFHLSSLTCHCCGSLTAECQLKLVSDWSSQRRTCKARFNSFAITHSVIIHLHLCKSPSEKQMMYITVLFLLWSYFQPILAFSELAGWEMLRYQVICCCNRCLIELTKLRTILLILCLSLKINVMVIMRHLKIHKPVH